MTPITYDTRASLACHPNERAVYPCAQHSKRQRAPVKCSVQKPHTVRVCFLSAAVVALLPCRAAQTSRRRSSVAVCLVRASGS